MRDESEYGCCFSVVLHESLTLVELDDLDWEIIVFAWGTVCCLMPGLKDKWLHWVEGMLHSWQKRLLHPQ